MPEPKPIVIEVVGEGKTDIGPTAPEPKAEPPTVGVVPVILFKLCGEPARTARAVAGPPRRSSEEPEIDARPLCRPRQPALDGGDHRDRAPSWRHGPGPGRVP